jgi:hypothetical protein
MNNLPKGKEIDDCLSQPQSGFLKYKLEILKEEFNKEMEEMNQLKEKEEQDQSTFTPPRDNLKESYKRKKKELIKQIYPGYEFEMKVLKRRQMNERAAMNEKHLSELDELSSRNRVELFFAKRFHEKELKDYISRSAKSE